MTASAVHEIFEHCTTGLVVSRRENTRFGIRVVPYCDIRGEVEQLMNYSDMLRTIGVTCTVQKGYMRIQGIDNCKIIAPLTKKQWLIDVMVLYDQGLHKKRDGIITIMKVSGRTGNHKGAITIEEAQSIIDKHL